MREAAARYLERLKIEGGKDLKMKRQRLDLHLVPFFGDYAHQNGSHTQSAMDKLQTRFKLTT